MYVEFRLSNSSSFRDMRGPKFKLGALFNPYAPSEKIFIREKSTWQRLNVCGISTL